MCHSTCKAALAPPAFTPAGGLVKAPTAVTLANPNSAGMIFYTLDGTDPRDVFGDVAIKARAYTRFLTVNRPMLVRARVRAGTEWSDLAAAAFTPDQDLSQLLFTEIMYHPASSAELCEFVELKNVGAKALDLSGLHFAALETPTIPVKDLLFRRRAG